MPNLRLIPADPSLAEQTAAYYRRNRDFLREFEPVREEAFFSVPCQRELLAKEALAFREKTAFRFYLELPENPGEIIGVIGLSNVVWDAFCSAFLGYKLDRRFLNRGYMTEAAGLLVRYAFEDLHLHRIEANVMPRNKASLRVLEKNRFVNEGLSPSYLKINGIWEDHIHMVKLNTALHT